MNDMQGRKIIIAYSDSQIKYTNTLFQKDFYFWY